MDGALLEDFRRGFGGLAATGRDPAGAGRDLALLERLAAVEELAWP